MKENVGKKARIILLDYTLCLLTYPEEEEEKEKTKEILA